MVSQTGLQTVRLQVIVFVSGQETQTFLQVQRLTDLFAGAIVVLAGAGIEAP
jgi:hypothetical protein